MYRYIYLITNKLNGKTYVGQHVCKSILKDDGYLGSGKIIKQAVAKYGAENFSKKIITIAMSQLEADVLEKFYIAKERSIGKAEYNIADGGQGGSHPSILKGKTYEDVFGKEKALEHRKKLSESHKGIPSGKKGKKTTEEIKRKISESRKGQPTWNKGKKGIYSEETLKKMSEHSKDKVPPSQKGKHRYNNGVTNTFAFECPEGWVKGWIKYDKY